MLKKMLLGLALALSLGATAGAESELDFTLVNATGYGIAAVYISPSASNSWEENVLEEVLGNKEAVEISFQPKAAKATKWDLMITWDSDDAEGGESEYWRGYKLSEISKITLKYDKAKDVTTAVTE